MMEEVCSTVTRLHWRLGAALEGDVADFDGAKTGETADSAETKKDDLILKDGAGQMVEKLVTHFEKTNPIPAQRLCLLYLTGDVAEWRHARSQAIESCPQVKLREAEYLWQVRADRHAPPTNPHHRTPRGERPRCDLSLCLLHALSQTSSWASLAQFACTLATRQAANAQSRQVTHSFEN